MKKIPKRAAPETASTDGVERPPAEMLYAAELAQLIEADTHPRPPGWPPLTSSGGGTSA